MEGYPAYDGDTSLYNVHKFMDLSAAEVGYFITQVGMSATPFGVADADVQPVGVALMSTFGYRCAPPAAVIPSQDPQLQSICIAEDCPISPNATCSSYEATTEPAVANGTTSGNATSASGGATSTGSAPATVTGVSGAGVTGFSFAAFAVGLAAFLL